MDKPLRELYRYKHYFDEFYDAQMLAVKKKIDYVLYLIQHADRVPEKFLKHIEATEGLYEMRVEVGSDIYRLFCCFDAGRLVILFNGFQKKTQKTPRNELDLAKRLMADYFDTKNVA
jgi:phage-related protein